MVRKLKYFQALNEGLDLSMARDPSVYVMGLGVPDMKGIFGTTLHLEKKYGPKRVFDIPAAENGMTGVAIGSALVGMRPVLVHMRLDFAILSVDTLVNQAAKWFYMFGGKKPVPMVVRMIVGRGWGQGAQHSQSLQSWFAHVPGLKVVMPATPEDAKGMLIAAIEDNNPVISIEHRWLYNLEGPVREGYYKVPLGSARVIRPGTDLTIVAISHMTIEAVRAAEILAEQGISAEVVDLRSLRPLDKETILRSVRKTGRLLVADTSWLNCGVSAEIISIVAEEALGCLKVAPKRLGPANCPSPSTPSLARHFFPSVKDLLNEARGLMGLAAIKEDLACSVPDDVPDDSFKGPF
jgi:acetoin:2,6-dichlorophenolindophenol oxidoreductase subunit beta